MSDNSFKSALGLLRDPNVSRLFGAYLVTYTGTAMAPIAMAFGVLQLTGSAADSAIVIAAPTAGSIAVLLLGGVIADRTSRQRVMWLAESVSMLSQLTMAYLFLSGQATVPLLTALMLINGVAMAFHVPAATGLIIQLVDRAQLQSVNALLGVARNAAMAGGAAFGGVLVATVGAGWTLALDGISFGLSALLVFTMRPRPQAPTQQASMLTDLRTGWQEFTRHTWLWVIVVQFSLVVAAGEAMHGLIGPAFTLDYMGGPRDWGYIASALGIGTLLGGLVGIKVRPKYPMRTATLLVFCFGGIAIAMLFAAPLWAVMAAALFSGFTGQIFGVLWYTCLQMKVPGEMLSRVSAYDHLGSIALAPLGVVAGGLLYENLGAQPTLLIAAATVVIPTALALCVRDVRTMTL
jgi:predicted MFS family arabinose efflux permease